MKPVLLASFCLTMYVLGFLAHSAIVDARNQKAIEIVHMPRFLFAGADLGFQVRVRGAIDEDRQQWVILCNLDDETPCSVDHNERVSMISIEGSATARLYAPRPWTHMAPGSFLVVAALGAHNQIRVSDSLTVTVQGM